VNDTELIRELDMRYSDLSLAVRLLFLLGGARGGRGWKLVHDEIKYLVDITCADVDGEAQTRQEKNADDRTVWLLSS
jgi:hypothetical protein